MEQWKLIFQNTTNTHGDNDTEMERNVKEPYRDQTRDVGSKYNLIPNQI